MKNFEEFKESRSGVDPSTRKMTDYQWEQAYAAYVSSRERARSSSSGRSKGGRERSRRSSSTSSSGRGIHLPSQASVAAELRATVRAKTAYADLRMIVDILGWLAVGLIVVGVVVKVIGYPNPIVATGFLLSACVQVVLAVALRLLAHVFIDIPDIALYREASAQSFSEDTGDDSSAESE